MRDRLDEFGDDVDVTVVMFSDPDHIDTYQHTNRLPFTIAIDEDRRAYEAVGFGRASLARVWGLRAAVRYARLAAGGQWRSLRRPVDDTRQLGGDILIDASGRVAWWFRGAGPDERPSVETMLGEISKARDSQGA